MVTTVRLDPADWRELRAAALDRTLAIGGAPDASAVLRDILAAWRRSRSGKTTIRSTRRKSP